MCRERLSAAARACGLKTDFYFENISAAARIAKRFVPCGKLLLIADEEDAGIALALRGAFAGFQVYSVVSGKENVGQGLFSLPDDLRAVVAVGGRSIAAARFFCTLRGAYLVAVPNRFGASELLALSAGDGYPVNEPDAVLFDVAFVGGKGRADGVAVAALSALYAEDIDVDGVFSGGRKDGCHETLRQSAKLAERGAEELFCALCMQETALRRFSGYPSRAFYHLLSGKGGHPDGECAFAALFYSLERYGALFGRGKPRAYFVPDYAARAALAAKYIGEAAYENVRVPSAKESFARTELFEECRAHFRVSAQILGGYADKIRERYYAAGGKKPRFEVQTLQDAFALSADLSPLTSVAALERDLGIPPHMRGGTYGEKTGSKA